MPTEGGGEPVLVGVIAKAHGLRGEVVVEVLSDAPERFAPGSRLRLRQAEGVERTLVITQVRALGRRLLVRFEGIEDRTGAERLQGLDLTIRPSEAAPLPEGQHYRFQLVGLSVRTRSGESLGTVAEVFATGSNDVLVVRGPTGELLLPALPDVVLEVATERGEIVVAVPEGLSE